MKPVADFLVAAADRFAALGDGERARLARDYATIALNHEAADPRWASELELKRAQEQLRIAGERLIFLNEELRKCIAKDV